MIEGNDGPRLPPKHDLPNARLSRDPSQERDPFEPNDPLRPYGVAEPPEPDPKNGNVWIGFFWVIGCHLIWLVQPWLYGLVGLGQLLYVVPLAVVFIYRGESRSHGGVWIAAALTFLLNVLGCGLMVQGLL